MLPSHKGLRPAMAPLTLASSSDLPWLHSNLAVSAALWPHRADFAFCWYITAMRTGSARGTLVAIPDSHIMLSNFEISLRSDLWVSSCEQALKACQGQKVHLCPFVLHTRTAFLCDCFNPGCESLFGSLCRNRQATGTGADTKNRDPKATGAST